MNLTGNLRVGLIWISSRLLRHPCDILIQHLVLVGFLKRRIIDQDAKKCTRTVQLMKSILLHNLSLSLSLSLLNIVKYFQLFFLIFLFFCLFRSLEFYFCAVYFYFSSEGIESWKRFKQRKRAPFHETHSIDFQLALGAKISFRVANVINDQFKDLTGTTLAISNFLFPPKEGEGERICLSGFEVTILLCLLINEH